MTDRRDGLVRFSEPNPGVVATAPLPASDGLSTFRATYRAEIPDDYSAHLHFALVVIVCLAVAVTCLILLEDMHWPELLCVPLTFVAANLVEYHAHRGPMHHPLRGLRLIYRRHVQQHHRFFRGAAMSINNDEDMRVTLFPLVMLAFFFGLIALPIGLLVLALTTVNAALLYVATAVLYYLCYECIHLAVHLPHGHWARRIPGIEARLIYHRLHHDPRYMSQCNFNISFPLADRLYGTRHRAGGERHPPPSA